MTRPPTRLREAPGRAAAVLPMDSFAVVMATGIVSIAANDSGYVLLSYVLEGVAALVFVALLVMVGLRLSHHWQVLSGNFRDPSQIFGFYAFVAACDVLNARLYLGVGPRVLLLILAVAAVGGWLVLVPVTWSALRHVPVRVLRPQARGSWLLAAVGTQSLAIIATDLGQWTGSPALLALALAWWVLGVAIYLGLCVLIVWRLLAERVGPRDVTPDSWVLMGALAIAALAGATVRGAAESLSAAGWVETVLVPGTLAVWAIGSAWIPLLVAGDAWRLLRVPGTPRYDRSRWATVFPLGMYASATYALARIWSRPAPALFIVSHVFFWIALVTWSVTMCGLVRAGYRAVQVP